VGGRTLKSATKGKVYKSPVRKLARFFERSRDQWKAKCQEAKATLKCLKSRVRFLEKSRERWREQAEELRRELAQVKAREREMAEKLWALSGARDQEPVASAGLADFALIPRWHQYSVGQVKLFISLVLSDAVSMRGAGRAIRTVVSSLQLSLSSPAWSTGRFWILRLGYYKLTRPKEQAEDWVWIVDHTVQLGAEKCLVILGVRLSAIPPCGECLSHEDVEPITLWPVEKSNGQVVYQQLEASVEKTGVPRQIISDHGTDLKAGIEQFCQNHQQTSAVYDIKHKTAAVLKRELGGDPTWLEFARLAAQTKVKVQQTVLAALAPPNQRTKARYMNVEGLIQWGQSLLAFLDQGQAERNTAFDAEQIQERLGWLTSFRQPLEEWGALLQVIIATESYVRQQGLSQGIHLELEEQLKPLTRTEPSQRVGAELIAFVTEEEDKAHPHERLLGSSEVIESVLGKMKRLEHDQARSGFTGLLLAISAMVSVTTTDVVRQTLETVPTKRVLAWCQEHLGQSVQAKRREALTSHGRTEQKWNQSWAPT
jgi:hypothetical protein